jgi:uncharacterized repeat protein (TIGR03847 family)
VGDLHELGDVDIFTIGTLGQPGQRTFFLQARRAGETFSVKCEKQQADALATYLGQLLTDLPVPDDLPLPVMLELDEPVQPLFVLGGIGVAWDQGSDRVVLSLEEVVATDEEGNPDPEEEAERSTMQLRITRGQALAFSRRGNEIVSAGRPPCRFCGLPLDPSGHPCPRMN